MKENRKSRPEQLQILLNRIDGVVIFLLLLLFALFLVVAFFDWPPSGAAIVVGMACSLTGGLLGFLFAVPRRVRIEGAAPVMQQTSRTDPPVAGGGSSAGPMSGPTVVPAYDSNTSLEEISDWLTKIIVGVGLVESKQIADALGEAGRAVGVGVYEQPPGSEAGEVLGVATILAFAVLGFMASFLWFRQHLMIAWARSHPRATAVAPERLSSAPPERIQSSMPPPAPAAMPEQIELSRTEHRQELDPALAERMRHKYLELRLASKHPEDWIKEMFGGAPSHLSPQRTLSASVRPVEGAAYYEVILKITSVPPAQGQVIFFLHNTFPQTTHVVPIDPTGVATLRVYAWGAFTAGALLDGGQTELELDLATLADSPPEFAIR